MTDELIDDFDDLTEANVEAKTLAKKLGGTLAACFVFVAFVIFLLIFFDDASDFLIGSSIAFLISAITAYYLGGKIGIQVLVDDKVSITRGILLSLLISALSGFIGGFYLMVVSAQGSKELYLVFLAAAVSLAVGAIPSLFFGFIYGLLLDSYKRKFNYVDEEE